ncbi:transglutaminase-like cysteine peptidase [Breoghania sp.]|uniref:transglutaminase-like cysteine peptidase n=1 Tax=Breoghania sp. TaxID=2065378 RepID=UPI002AAACF49|nr:transglutaminase-like cysteine peptidase [Breoghania sp.]
MKFGELIFATLVAAAFTLGVSLTDEAAAGTEAFMATTGSTSAPVGHVEFCRQRKSECGMTATKAKLMTLSRARWDELLKVNAEINRRIRPVSDMDLYHREEVWTYPVNAGDCEDFALLKRKVLIKLGWPASSLLMTVVRDIDGSGHAVLTVRTDRGDLVLDNQIEAVLPWYRTPYRYIKRQSETNAARWTAINDARVGAVASIPR